MKKFIISLAVILGVVGTVINWINPKKEKYLTYTAIAPLVAFGIAQGISTLGGLAVDAIGRKRQMKQNRELAEIQQKNNLAIMAKQNEYQMKMWENTNASAQVEQYKKAGLNVGLMYGGSGQGGQSQLGSTSGGAGQGQAGGQVHGMEIQQAMQMAMLQSQLEVNKSIASKNNAEAEKTKGVDTEETISKIEQLKQITTNAKVQEAIMRYEEKIKEIEANVNKQTEDEQINNLKLANEELKKTIEGQGLDNQLKEGVMKDLIIQANQTTAEQQLRMMLIKANITNVNLDTKQKQEAINKIVQEISKLKQETANLRQERDIQWQEMENDKKRVLMELMRTEFQTSDEQREKILSEIWKKYATTTPK